MYSSVYDVPLASLPQSEDINLTYTHCDVPQATVFLLGDFQQLCCHITSAPLPGSSCSTATTSPFTSLKMSSWTCTEMPGECASGCGKSGPHFRYYTREKKNNSLGKRPKKGVWAMSTRVKIQSVNSSGTMLLAVPLSSLRELL